MTDSALKSSPELTPNTFIARAAARQLWLNYGFESARQLQLEDLAFAEGIIVAESPLESADAWLVRSDQRGIIRIRSSIPEAGRKRFAIAHELGHWFLHKHVSQLFTCTSEDLAARYRGSPVEIEANLFASELLMPSHLFASRAREAPPTIGCLENIAAEFQTSFTATAIRYIECATRACAVVCTREEAPSTSQDAADSNNIRWWMASRSFADLCGSAGGREARGITASENGEPSFKSMLAKWKNLPSLRDLHSETLPMPEYRQHLHLVWK